MEVTAATHSASHRQRPRSPPNFIDHWVRPTVDMNNMNIDVDPDWGTPPGESVASTAASDQGAGSVGFAGTVSKGNAAGGAIGYASR